MKKIYLHRKITVWVEEEYNIEEELDKNLLDNIISYEIVPDDSEVMWETQEDEGITIVLDEKRNPIKEYNNAIN